jgi:hypothetical protein
MPCLYEFNARNPAGPGQERAGLDQRANRCRLLGGELSTTDQHQQQCRDVERQALPAAASGRPAGRVESAPSRRTDEPVSCTDRQSLRQCDRGCRLAPQRACAQDHEADRQRDQPETDRQAARLGDQANQRRPREEAAVAGGRHGGDADTRRQLGQAASGRWTRSAERWRARTPCRRSRPRPRPDGRRAAPRRAWQRRSQHRAVARRARRSSGGVRPPAEIREMLTLVVPADRNRDSPYSSGSRSM